LAKEPSTRILAPIKQGGLTREKSYDVKGHRRELPQSIYDQVVCNIMKNGEKSKAIRLVDEALEKLAGLVRVHNKSEGEDKPPIIAGILIG
jgi:hypothetical protein